MQRVIALALTAFLANYGVLYSVLPAAIFADDPNPLLYCAARSGLMEMFFPNWGSTAAWFFSLPGKEVELIS